jgi:hypothetical protein
VSTPATALKPVSQHNVLLITADGRAAFESRLRQSIQDRAYQLFEIQGGNQGQDQANWAQAEAELLQYAPPVREMGAWCTANVSLQNIDPHDVQVLVLDDHAIVAVAKPEPEPDPHGGNSARTDGSPAYLLIRWPIHVDPATAAAYMKDNTLVVTAKHCASKGRT